MLPDWERRRLAHERRVDTLVGDHLARRRQAKQMTPHQPDKQEMQTVASPSVVAAAHRVLPEHEWRERRLLHESRIDGWLGDHLARRSKHGRHSIEEFLLTYYNYRPAQLRRWHPGQGVSLAHADASEFGPQYTQDPDGHLRLDVHKILGRRRGSIGWIYTLLKATAGRAPHYGCFGMHEWAMVYRQTESETRHNVLPLRLGSEATSALVEEIKVKCSHFDAFRFFTQPARPLNLLQPTRETQFENEQPGCLHANMDVYRWAYKLAPLVASELVADCFSFAREVRTLDMQASPYDLSGLGLHSLPIETPEGRAEYIRQQRNFATRASALRQGLIDVCSAVLSVQP